MLKEILNEEQMLDLCLFKYMNDKSVDDTSYVVEYMIAYILTKNPDGLTEEEICEKLNEMITDYTIKMLIDKGDIEPTS